MRGVENYYYPQTIRMVIESVMGLFNNIVVFRFDKKQNKTKQIKVPVHFGSSMKRQRFENSEEARKFYTQLPRINVKWDGLRIASDRISSPLTERHWNDEEINFKDVDENSVVIREINGLFKDFNPIPYDYPFNIEIVATSLNDICQILENVLPYFMPENTSVLRVREFSFLNIERDLPVEIDSVNIDLNYDFGEEDDRLITAEFSLGVSGYIYRPISGTKLIHTINSDYFIPDYLDKTIRIDVDGTHYFNTEDPESRLNQE